MFSRRYQRYALFTLTTVYILSFMDRMMIGMLMQPIKEELQLSDTQLGFLTGIAFALFYATLGIPIARWADRGNRVAIISLAMAIWGSMVMLTGAITNFLQLVLVRIGAAVGEAGCMPPAYSLIGDYFPASERPRAFAVYMSGISVSLVVSHMFAGWMNEAYGWRVAFLVIGLPGLLVALLVKFTLREPRCSAQSSAPVVSESQPPLWQVLASLWRQPTYRHLVIALTLVNFVGIGLGQWLPSFFIRSHGTSTAMLGLWMGLVGGASGILGTYFGGVLIDRYWGNNPQGQVRCIALGVLFLAPCYWLLLFLSDTKSALAVLIPLNILFFFLYGPVMSLIQSLVVETRRAIAVAFSMLILNLIGMGLGPQVVGILSDWLRAEMGSAEALRMAMGMAAAMAFGSAYYFWLAGKTIAQDLSESA